MHDHGDEATIITDIKTATVNRRNIFYNHYYNSHIPVMASWASNPVDRMDYVNREEIQVENWYCDELGEFSIGISSAVRKKLGIVTRCYDQLQAELRAAQQTIKELEAGIKVDALVEKTERVWKERTDAHYVGRNLDLPER